MSAIGLTVAAFILAAFAAFRLHRAAAFWVLVAAIAFSASELTGTCKPVMWEWRAAEEAGLIAVHPVPEEAIYVLLEGPRCYALPWSAETMQKMQQQAEEGGADKIMDPFKWDGMAYEFQGHQRNLPEKR